MMAILTAADLTALAPGINQSQPGAIAGLLLRVQEWCEGPLGAGRPLEQVQHREILRVPWSESQLVQLSRVPILNPPEPIIEIHQGGPGAWSPLSSTAYSLDPETGEVELFLLTTSGFEIRFDGYGHNQSNHVASTEIRATYTSGWDFSVSSPIVDLMKAVAVELALFLWTAEGGNNKYSATALSQSSGIGAGAIKKRMVDDQISVEYHPGTSSATKNISTLAADGELEKAISSLLYPLKKYQPRRIAAFGV